MPTDTSFASFAKRLDGFVNGLSGAQLKAIANRIGVEAKKDAEHAAAMDLGGDPKFSGWKPVLQTRFDHVGPGRISFHPTKSAAGPWTVAEFGRNSAAGPPMLGPKTLKSGKMSKAKVKKWNGRTQGKGTATTALAIIDKETPKRVEDEVRIAMKKAFG